ncbi:MAG: DNRLRE domain-containing protein [Chthoniobacter sp.]|uniref:DNRLRE domain-containing protein n=1 Tax=Chthoniobacter sp. TaxID=2510640 RepID=UPI0032A2DA3A
MNPPDSQVELRELCDRLLDGNFSPEDRARLEALVLGDPALRRRYVEIMHQHAALRQNASRLGDVPLSEVLQMSPDEPAKKVIRFPRWPLQLAAAVVLGFGIWLLVPHPAEKPLATLVETNGARWDNSSLPTVPGSPLRAGRLRLESGVARLVFQSGAEVSLEGPAELELQGPNACFLHSGALTAHVPVQARGFIVGTAHAQLIDHGTDFGISADPGGRGQVQVLKGEVELRHDRSGETRRLQTHESAAITPDRFTQTHGGEGEPDRYAFVRPNSVPHPTTLTLTTAGGAGDAAYVVSPNSPIHFSDTLLLVKNAPTKGYRRKAYLRFDLTPLRERHVAEASLTLNFESTGFGYASLTGECTFAVYGLTDDAQDDWSAETLSWENAPAFSPDAGTVDPGRAVKLGTFTTPRGVVSGTFAVEGQALAGFLNADANRRATLIVVRETSEPGNNAAVHGFAGNHHPTLAPPTLKLTLADR